MTLQRHTGAGGKFHRCGLVLAVAFIIGAMAVDAQSANVKLAWDANSEPGIVGYRVFCGESSGNYFISQDVTAENPGDPPPTTCEFTGLQEGKKYYFSAIVYSDTEQSGYSPEISYTVPVAWDPDGDGDGFTAAQGDCNDADSSIHPDAAETCGDGIDQDCDGADLSCPDDFNLTQEARDGDLDGDFTIAADSGAASGYYVHVPNGSGTYFNGPSESQKISFTFNLASAGTYRIKGRVYAPNGADDSFWVKVNDSPAGGYLWDVLQNTNYREDYVNDRYGADPVEVSLSAGVNTVAVYLREDGTRLESIELEPVATAGLPMEFGTIQLDHTWQSVALNRSFSDPVVVASAVSYNGGNPTVVRVRNVTSSGFEVRLQEYEYLDDWHVYEQVSYIVIERGSYQLPGGTRVEAGRFTANAVSSFGSVQFNQPFHTAPVVLTTIDSLNESDAVAMRLKDITTSKFDYRMQEQEINSEHHLAEQAGYIAWEPSAGSLEDVVFDVGKTSNTVTHTFQALAFSEQFSSPPAFLAAIQTTDGGDTAAVRWQNKQSDGIEVKVEEEQSRDSETNHTTEVIGYMVFEDQVP